MKCKLFRGTILSVIDSKSKIHGKSTPSFIINTLITCLNVFNNQSRKHKHERYELALMIEQ